MQNWPFWIAGMALGGFVPLFAWTSGKLLGISSGYAEACALHKPAGSERWKLWFALGLPLGGLLAAFVRGGPHIASTSAALAENFHVGNAGQYVLPALGGLLVGYGSRMAGGCTSGHSIVGIALGAKSSLVATIGFILEGFAATWLLIALAGRLA
ncbi:MAG: YeeE/YedE family protein [Planctomycetota bacterium]